MLCIFYVFHLPEFFTYQNKIFFSCRKVFGQRINEDALFQSQRHIGFLKLGENYRDIIKFNNWAADYI